MLGDGGEGRRRLKKTKSLVAGIVTPRPERSMRGNRRVSLDEPQLPETHPKTRKAFSTITRLKNGTLAHFIIHTKHDKFTIITEILPKI